MEADQDCGVDRFIPPINEKDLLREVEETDEHPVGLGLDSTTADAPA